MSDQTLTSRRGTLLLSGAALALLAGCETAARDQPAASETADAASLDAGLLNAALALEYEAIFAYRAGAGSGLLTPAQLELAGLFLAQHEEHRDLLIRTVERIGGAPVDPEGEAVYAARLELATLASAEEVLALATRLEKGAANAYLGVLPKFSDPLYGQFSARIAADEVMHWTALTRALGRPLPERALSFG